MEQSHKFSIKNKSIFTHVKLNIYPDGGVARLRLYGEIETKNINYGRVLEVMGTLSWAGFSKVALISEPYKN